MITHFLCYHNQYATPFKNLHLHHGKITDITSKEIMYHNLNMIYIEIPKLKKEKEELNSHLEWWLYVFQNLNKLQEIPQKLKGDVIEKAFERAEFLKLPKVEQEKKESKKR